MTTFLWSTLAGGSTNAFNAATDILSFDDASISASDGGMISWTGTDVIFSVSGKANAALDKAVHFTITGGGRALTDANVTYLNGSKLLIGDNTHGIGDGISTFDDAANSLTGTAGGDLFIGLGGNDTINGGTGIDTADYRNSPGTVSVNLATGTASDGWGGTDTLVSIENVAGSGFNDSLTGDAQNNVLDGGAGNDVLNGAAGNDTASYASAGGQVTVRLALTTPQNTLGAGTDTLLNIENVTGSAFGDDLQGNAGNNVLVGGAGGDLIRADAGNDTLDGGAGADTAIYSAATSGVRVNLGTVGPQDTGALGHDTLSGFEFLNGSSFPDTLTGDAGDNFIFGDAGNDLLDGGAGNDTLNGGTGSDTASYASALGAVLASLASGQATGAAGTDTFFPASIENLTGSGFNDILTGDGGANVLDGGAGNDIVDGGAGNDIVDGRAGADTLIGGLGNDTYIVDNTGDVTSEFSTVATEIDTVQSSATRTLGANLENLTLTGAAAINGTGNTLNNILVGNAAANTLNGGAGTDVLRGEAGNDILDGGTGSNDSAYYNTASAGVNVNLTTGLATGGAGSDTLTGIENLLGSNSNDVLVGNALANTLNGGAGNDVLRGEAGNDILDGGTGSNDWAYYNSAGAGVNVNLTTGLATGGAGSDTLTGIENLLGSNSNDVLVGNALANTLSGGAGNDVLRGEAGNDILDGGTGSNDWAYYNSAGAGVNVNLTTGLATGGAGSDTLTGIENLLGSNSNDVLVGNALANTLNGGAGNDVLRGEAGNDILDGGTGSNDWAYYNSAGAGVNVNLATGLATGGAGSDTLTGIENLLGSNSNDVLVGNALANTLNGGAGNDVLRGEAGNDILDGGTGSNDWAYYNSASAGVNVNLATGLATGGAGSDTLTGIENLLGSNSNDVLVGNALANTLSGGAGADTLNGGLGNDTYIVDNAGDITTETSTLATEIDTVQSSVTRTLGANLENLTLTGAAAINGTGNTLNNTLTGNGVANSLDGGVGNDTLNGGAGADTLIGGAGADLFVFNSKVGSDSVTDFVSGTDKFAFSQAGIHIGNGDTEINGVAFGAGPGGFLPSMELVVMTNDIAGAINTTNAAAAIGSAAGAYAVGNTSLFVVDNGTASDLFLFTSSGTDAVVSAAELTLVGVATSTAAIAPADFTFVA